LQDLFYKNKAFGVLDYAYNPRVAGSICLSIQ
jgi:hypothetical protein